MCAQTDPEAFFPEKGGSTREAKRVCRSCEVRAECLEYALENDERFGIWGGMSERERRRLKRAGRLTGEASLRGWLRAAGPAGAPPQPSAAWVPRRLDIARSPGWTCAGCVSLVLS